MIDPQLYDVFRPFLDIILLGAIVGVTYGAGCTLALRLLDVINSEKPKRKNDQIKAIDGSVLDVIESDR